MPDDESVADPMAEYRRLRGAVETAEFDCGNWRDDDDEPYDMLLAAATEARDKLDGFVARLVERVKQSAAGDYNRYLSEQGMQERARRGLPPLSRPSDLT